jgi:hypothetical protein
MWALIVCLFFVYVFIFTDKINTITKCTVEIFFIIEKKNLMKVTLYHYIKSIDKGN